MFFELYLSTKGRNMTTKITLNGFYGKMGEAVRSAAEDRNDVSIVEGFDKTAAETVGVIKSKTNNIYICHSFRSAIESKNPSLWPAVSGLEGDVILDFSNQESLQELLEAAEVFKKPLVIATTGYSKEQEASILRASFRTPILKASNFSTSVYHFVKAVADFAKVWKYDIEIVEAHHNRKADAPSGTAKTLADEIIKARGYGRAVYGRTGKREADEIGISSVRGGNIVGEHEVRFISPFNEVTMKESENSRGGFADGALDACVFMAGKKGPNPRTGNLYTLEDLIKG
jgi:4-hydroxy-tetrahydrodipicolinate reductase